MSKKHIQRRRGRPKLGEMKRISAYIDDRMFVYLRRAGHGNASFGLRCVLERLIEEAEKRAYREQKNRMEEMKAQQPNSPIDQDQEIIEDPFDL